MEPKRVMICPLDWGLGHATRCIPLISLLLEMGCEVIVAAGSEQRLVIHQSFGDRIRSIRFPGYRPLYLKKGFGLSVLLQAPILLGNIVFEHFFLRKLVREFSPALIISDNRYGVWHPDLPAVFISHQLHPIAPPALKWISPMAMRLMNVLLKRFSECWVPDVETGHSLSGMLSQSVQKKLKVFRIGILSRFSISLPNEETQGLEAFFEENKVYAGQFVLIMLSGPEPARSRFEQKLLDDAFLKNEKCVLLRGKPSLKTEVDNWPEQWVVFKHLDTNRMQWLIRNARSIVCRSGYSSLMDLVALRRKALLIPTLGQTEQEYLARRMQHIFGFRWLAQEDFSYSRLKGFEDAECLWPQDFKPLMDKEKLSIRISSLLSGV